MIEQERLVLSTESKYLCNALECVKISFVRNASDLNNEDKMYAPEFAHQHFENEVIYGYQDLHLNINYTDASMYVTVSMKSKANIQKEVPSAKADDINTLLREQLPKDQLSMMVTKDRFFAHLDSQKKFKPFGSLIDKFTASEKQFELFKVNESSEDFDSYLARIQTVAMWYIDAADYTDNTDPRWMHYLLYESYPSPEGDGSRRYALAGYFSLYRFYHHPQGCRVRIAQAMLFPQYRRAGLGPRLLQSVYRDLLNEDEVFDVTAEDPADNFVLLRDYVDCLNCQTLPEFSIENLKKGYSGEMQNVALNKFKMHSKQTRRVYEILRFASTDKSNSDDLKAYRIDVKRRLEAPLKSDRVKLSKLCNQLNPEEAKNLTAGESAEQKIRQLSSMYEETIDGYQQVINRLEKYPEII